LDQGVQPSSDIAFELGEIAWNIGPIFDDAPMLYVEGKVFSGIVETTQEHHIVAAGNRITHFVHYVWVSCCDVCQTYSRQLDLLVKCFHRNHSTEITVNPIWFKIGVLNGWCDGLIVPVIVYPTIEGLKDATSTLHTNSHEPLFPNKPSGIFPSHLAS
jgi:hypothetical protein